MQESREQKEAISPFRKIQAMPRAKKPT